MNNCYIGIEIEGILKIEGLNEWIAERDGSLNKSGFFSYEEPIEIISPTFKGEKSFLKGLKDFKNYFSNFGEYELDEVLYFNSSCGGHIHFSIKNFSFKNKVIFEIFKKVRNKFFKEIKNSNIESKKEIIKQYFRGYAKKLTEEVYKYKRCREAEFNFISEDRGKGLEWRSPNLLGIQNWKEFLEYWNIILKCLKYFYEISQKYEILNTFLLKIEDNYFKNENITFKTRKKKKTYAYYEIPIKFKNQEVIKCVI